MPYTMWFFYVMCFYHLLYVTNMAVMRIATEYCYGHVTFILCRCRWAVSPVPSPAPGL